MAEIWVANASPVIILAKAGCLELLTGLAEKVLVPGTVVSEIMSGPRTDPARQVLERGWGERVYPKSIPDRLL
ncbi:MAG: hypothetical protein GXP27_15420 [Planctomycetes bacterium]|nr:hypothetical protein [Planctomycetota bacterium]